MSLLLWEYHLDPTEWGVVTTPTSSAGAANAGGGSSRYVGPDPDFWLARERYLKRFLPQIAQAQLTEAKLAKAPAEEQSHLRMLANAQAAIALRAQRAENEAQFRDAISRFKQLSLDIEQVFDDYYAQAAIILLLDLF